MMVQQVMRLDPDEMDPLTAPMLLHSIVSLGAGRRRGGLPTPQVNALSHWV
jgi:hypothetical protein